MSRYKRYIGFGIEEPSNPSKFYVGIVDDTETDITDLPREYPNDSIQLQCIEKSKQEHVSRFTEHITNDVSHSIKYSISLNFRIGDMFDAPNNSVLIHTTNCSGKWDSGVGSKFALIYPKAYEKYKLECRKSDTLGRCILIPPSEDNGPRHYIACLFTHRNSMTINDKDKILKNLVSAVNDMLLWISFLDPQPAEIRMCKVYETNGRVLWQRTRDAISEIETIRRYTIHIIDRS